MVKTIDLTYAEQLQADYNRIRNATIAGTLPLEARLQAIDDAVNQYALSHAEAYERAVSAEESSAELEKRKPQLPPINYKDDRILHAFADLALHEDLTWSHADKMSIVEYPVMSRHQAKLRQGREISISDVYTGKGDETIGRSRDSDGINRRIYDYMTPDRDVSVVPAKYLDLYDALDNAGLTERQAEAIQLVYFESLTQEGAAERMGVTDRAVRYFISEGIAKIRRYLT